jgi:hypothetical protein
MARRARWVCCRYRPGILDEELAVRVGGPLSVLRAEAAGLLHRLVRLSENTTPLLVFIDNLVLLDKSGEKQFLTPDPETSSTSMILLVL